MVIDFHTHLFPEFICSRRDAFYDSEPAFEALYRSPKSRLVSAPELLAAMDENGIDKSVIFGFPWQKAELFRRHNDFIMDTVQRHPNRLIGFGCFDPGNVEAAQEAERCLDGGLAGIGELAFYQSGIETESIEQLAPVMDLCRERGRPVLIHTNEPVGHAYPGKTPNTLAQIYRMVERFPANAIVLAHWGGGLFFFSLLKRDVKHKLRNVYFDTAASPFLYDAAIYRIAIQVAGIDKILFGSDFPLIQPARYFKELQAAGLSDAERQQLCGTNASRVLGLG